MPSPATRELPSTFRPAWWLPGPHLPTIYSKLVRRIAMPAEVSRRRLPMPDGDVVSIDRLPGHPSRPRVILLHGLEGGAHSTYARGVLREARTRGWAADLNLWRTCDGEPVNRVGRAYHSGASDDADYIIRTLAGEEPTRDHVLIGVSLGGNVLLKWLGEQGDRLPPNVRAAVAASVPFDLARASRHIDSGVRRVYARFFLKSLVAKSRAKLERFPELPIDRDRLARVRTLWEFDDVVTGPLHGFRDAADYYERSSSLRYLHGVRLPTLLLHAQDDPFLPRPVLDDVRAAVAANPYLHGEFPRRGGHVGFIGGPHPWAADYWFERRALDWLGHQVR